MQKNKMFAYDLIKYFELKIINEDCEPLNRQILSPAIKRVGLELSEREGHERLSHNVIAWGTSESRYFDRIGETETRLALENIFVYSPPLVLLSKGMSKKNVEIIKSISSKYKIPVSYNEYQSSAFTTASIGAYLNEFFAETVQVHGCLMMVNATGVLIIGPSGSGKSEAALELVQKGHIFVSDDAVLVKDLGNQFVGSSPYITKNFLEVRGIGAIDVKYTYGVKSIANSCVIKLVIELVQKEEQNKLDRLGISFLNYPIMSRSIKKIQVPAKEGGSVASLIEAAVSSYLARHEGYSVIEEIEKRRLEDE